jgi:L-alanine-DL-glutamate epimerase-like enolase superfamily enzyme
MELSFTSYRLNCTHPFGISRSTNDYYDIVYVYLSGAGFIGKGEAAPSARYGETKGQVIKQLNCIEEVPDESMSVEDGDIWCSDHSGGISALQAALSTAWLDWWTQKEKVCLADYFKSEKENMPLTSFTIAIGDLNLIPQKIAEAAPYRVLKIKLGVGLRDDQQIINLIRAETDKLIRVDANEGWDLETGLTMCKWLADHNVEFVEQPFKADNLHDTAVLQKKSPLPLIADEDSIVAANIPYIAPAFDGINIKLMKCASLLEGKRMIDTARDHDLQIMLGCMVESAVGITAAAHLAPQVDYADLDGNLLIDNDPYNGVQVKDGRLVLPHGNGLGVVIDSNYKKNWPELK